MTWPRGLLVLALSVWLDGGGTAWSQAPSHAARGGPPPSTSKGPGSDAPDPQRADSVAPGVAAGEGKASSDAAAVHLLDRLEEEERTRAAERAAEEERDRTERLARDREQEERRRRRAAAEMAAATAHALRVEAMAAWHASFAQGLEPVLRARATLYRRMRSRLFARVRPQCEAIAAAVEAASVVYAPAPERRIDVLARDLLAVYRESARHCASGAYFSFTVQERRVRWLARELIAAFEPFGLAFPRADGDPSH
jgi:hypothetical protein